MHLHEQICFSSVKWKTFLHFIFFHKTTRSAIFNDNCSWGKKSIKRSSLLCECNKILFTCSRELLLHNCCEMGLILVFSSHVSFAILLSWRAILMAVKLSNFGGEGKDYVEKNNFIEFVGSNPKFSFNSFKNFDFLKSNNFKFLKINLLSPLELQVESMLFYEENKISRFMTEIGIAWKASNVNDAFLSCTLNLAEKHNFPFLYSCVSQKQFAFPSPLGKITKIMWDLNITSLSAWINYVAWRHERKKLKMCIIMFVHCT